ncbi:hypothetical protein Tco_0360671 [Tanacetum coccineum]
MGTLMDCSSSNSLLLGWLYRVNQFFLLDSIPDNQKVRLVSMHMFDKALNWHKQFIRMLNGLFSLFIGGLKDDISMSVRMFKPNTMTDVYCLGKMQEATLQVVKTKHTPLLTTPRTPYVQSASYANRNVSYPPKSTTTTLALPAPTTAKPVYVQPRKQLTQKEIHTKEPSNFVSIDDRKFVPWT